MPRKPKKRSTKKDTHSSHGDNYPGTHGLIGARGANIPQLLVSVRDVQEAREAVAGGADWIDLKDPQQGPLGPVDRKTAHEVSEAFSTSHSISAAAGELQDWQSQGNLTTPGTRFSSREINIHNRAHQPHSVAGALGVEVREPNRGRSLTSIPGIGLLKLGLAGCYASPHWQDHWCVVQAETQKVGKQLVAVVYADWEEAAAPRPEQILEHACNNGCKTLLIDTYCKTKGTVLDCLSFRDLTFLLERARKASLRTVVAGSLSIDSLSRLILLPISLVAVRGAVCSGGRNGILKRMRIEQFQRVLRSLPWEGD